MLKKLKKFTNLPCEVKTFCFDDKFKHELFVNGKKVAFVWESKIKSDYDQKDTAINEMVKKFYNKIQFKFD